MSEELIKRGLQKNGLKFGNYEYYNIGDTNINSLRAYDIIPNKPYSDEVLRKKPDGILVDRSNKSNIQVLVVVEHKQPSEFDTQIKKEVAIKQCIENYCKPLKAKIGIVTDGTDYIWLNPQLKNNKFDIILREDDYPLHNPFLYGDSEEIEHSLEIVKMVLSEINSTNSKLIKRKLLNPSELADKVWQTIWLASGENPDVCLATFVEIFIFKFISDLNVLTENENGLGVSFNETLSKDRDKCLRFYFNYVRPHIKLIFPASETDGTSIINGTVLNPEIEEHNILFHSILREFDNFGELTHIEPEFKSRLYEHFLKKSISQKNWGQFFTPRNIVKSMVELSDIENLTDGAKVHDPACGVGGFILEPILTKRQRDFRFSNGELKSKIIYTGHDRDSKTIILAKANMLLHLNELVSRNSGSPQEFAKLFNKTFRSLHSSLLGSLSEIEIDKYDLILTNPPFVVTGTSKFKEFIFDNGTLKNYYKINAIGVEGLFLEKIIRSTKPGGKILTIVPDGILNRVSDKKIREFIKKECLIDAIISLPENAFYTTPKKTYILALTKKVDNTIEQNTPIYSYMVTKTGETLDTNRFLDENDLPEMVKYFKYFKADRFSFEPPNLKCKVWDFSLFQSDTHWSIDRWWTEEERIELGLSESMNVTTISDFTIRLENEKMLLTQDIEELNNLKKILPKPDHVESISFSNKLYFELFIGKRILKKHLILNNGDIPVYSANVKTPWGYLETSNIIDFNSNYVLWGIDGNWEFSIKNKGVMFRTTDHCGAIKILNESINPEYLYYSLNWIKTKKGLDRGLRASLTNMNKIEIDFPVKVDENGIPKTLKIKSKGKTKKIFDLDFEIQAEIAAFYKTFEEVKTRIKERMQHILDLEIEPLQ
ncbi:N-6 DNA methylase [Chryseobacterium lathyri]|jgi:type I restriction-modification system DNA methylase subunit|uniref:site-specific DNA-methyltransferase (adenine-specific) n=1 Tax=Chryseobacterium lathyri TaxID=395933 RepID=A0A511YES0_9FLAO|nr:N-6 DNA methylase [Chryseobacterium lathyri]GEN73694.1 hypothetical protein CLA01_37660 [Chryseobacterium lathyri]